MTYGSGFGAGLAVGRQMRDRHETFRGINNEPAYDPRLDPEVTSKQNIKKAAVITGGAAAVPATLYAAGLRREGVPWGRIPQVAWGDIRALGTHKDRLGRAVQGSLGPIGHTMRGGAGEILSGTKHAIVRAGRSTKMNISSFYKGLRGLSSRLDDIINFEEH